METVQPNGNIREEVRDSAMPRQTAVTAYFPSKQLQLFVLARQISDAATRRRNKG